MPGRVRKLEWLVRGKGERSAHVWARPRNPFEDESVRLSCYSPGYGWTVGCDLTAVGARRLAEVLLEAAKCLSEK